MPILQGLKTKGIWFGKSAKSALRDAVTMSGGGNKLCKTRKSPIIGIERVGKGSNVCFIGKLLPVATANTTCYLPLGAPHRLLCLGAELKVPIKSSKLHSLWYENTHTHKLIDSIIRLYDCNRLYTKDFFCMGAKHHRSGGLLRFTLMCVVRCFPKTPLLHCSSTMRVENCILRFLANVPCCYCFPKFSPNAEN